MAVHLAFAGGPEDAGSDNPGYHREKGQGNVGGERSSKILVTLLSFLDHAPTRRSRGVLNAGPDLCRRCEPVLPAMPPSPAMQPSRWNPVPAELVSPCLTGLGHIREWGACAVIGTLEDHHVQWAVRAGASQTRHSQQAASCRSRGPPFGQVPVPGDLQVHQVTVQSWAAPSRGNDPGSAGHQLDDPFHPANGVRWIWHSAHHHATGPQNAGALAYYRAGTFHIFQNARNNNRVERVRREGQDPPVRVERNPLDHVGEILICRVTKHFF